MRFNSKYMPFKALALLCLIVFVGVSYNNCGMATVDPDGTRQSEETLDGVRQKVFIDFPHPEALSSQQDNTTTVDEDVIEYPGGSYELNPVIFGD